MAKAEELKLMAQERLDEAQLLYVNTFFSGAYYLSGYAIELGLKAVICKRLNIEMFDGQAPGKVAKTFQIHELPDLIILSGLHQNLEKLKNEDVNFAKTWSIVSGWSEQRRYEYGCKLHTAKKFLDSVVLFMSWIQQYW
ncbi:hypothetical protein GCM10027275_42460 [Rhabdobacter roseus]|uniref:HEPN domain-containing protein n=1 Tax=Rhabdobacter roseus TaxID=1655419 RepID=A0A840TTJ6_9BACT|nr:HEPN domain-containing protein [Rhabdobacter roseus]MBB5286225.1 hypothetical protein [Rhabdobacter roseus]